VIFLGNDVNRKPRMKILNYDGLVSEKLPALNTVGDVLLWRLPALPDSSERQQFEIAIQRTRRLPQATKRLAFRVGSSRGSASLTARDF